MLLCPLASNAFAHAHAVAVVYAVAVAVVYAVVPAKVVPVLGCESPSSKSALSFCDDSSIVTIAVVRRRRRRLVINSNININNNINTICLGFDGSFDERNGCSVDKRNNSRAR
jgi:hypothetical protein